MFRHNDYIQKVDYPFNAGYVIYANYFFPSTSTGESSDVPLKEFPKAFEQNFKYFVDESLNDLEKQVLSKTFIDKKSFSSVANEIGISTKELTSIRTRAFVKLRSVNRTKYILSDIPYVPKVENKSNIRLGNITVDSILKTPDLSTGGGDYRLINVKRDGISLFTLRMSTRTNNMSDIELHDFMVKLAELSNLLKFDE